MKINILNLHNYEYIKKKYNVSLLCAKVLSSMQLTSEQIEYILYDHTTTNDFDLSFFKPLIERLHLAKKNNERVIVCGDYDCDGICATTILVDALRKFGIETNFYIPNRFTEGYGLNENTVIKAKEKGYQILITVDNGVRASKALMKARELGIEIILTDHHSYDEEELVYDYFVHPKVLHSFYDGMCGAGIAYLIAKSLIGNEERHTMLACVATIGDMVPLLNANRTLVKEGIRLLNTRNFGALQWLQNDTKRWDEKKIAFQVVPKINCVGRLADEANVNTLVRYFLLQDENQIQNYLYQINALNEKRKSISASMEAIATANITGDPFLILHHSCYHEGINGVVASKISKATSKPTMVLTQKESICKGSIRSVGVDLTTFFDDFKSSLIAYGGHREAAGISLYTEHLDALKEFVNTKMEGISNECSIDCIQVKSDEIKYDDLTSLNVIAPFGNGFEMPLFMIEDTIDKIQQLSDGKHLKYLSQTIQYLYFNQGKRFIEDQNKKTFTFIGKLEGNSFYHNKSVTMMVDYMID